MKGLPNTHSITFRLISAVLAVELLSSVAVIFLSLGYERHAHFTAFDIMLRGRADSLLVAVQDSENVQADLMLNPEEVSLPLDDVYEVYDQNGRLLGRSPNWQGAPAEAKNDPSDGYLRTIVNGRHYRVLRLHGSRFVDAGEPGGGKLRLVTIFYGAGTERVWHAIHKAVNTYAMGALLLLAITGPLMAWLLHRGLLPLRQLAALASAVSVNSWRFDPPASARATPELAPLTNAIESALGRLERSFQQQRTFVSDAAHELKTAVAVVKSSLQLLAMRRRTSEEYKAGLDRCLADSDRLEEVVGKMLTLAREEGGAQAPGPHASADLAQSLYESVKHLESMAAIHGVQLIVNAAEGVCMVPLAADDCLLLITNLLENAVKHSQPESKVECRLSIEDGTAELRIVDRGDGIPAEALPHVFDRFYRGDPSRNRNTGGTGLGLAICKAIVERARGSITLVSQTGPEQPNRGTTVSVRLPLVPDAPAS